MSSVNWTGRRSVTRESARAPAYRSRSHRRPSGNRGPRRRQCESGARFRAASTAAELGYAYDRLSPDKSRARLERSNATWLEDGKRLDHFGVAQTALLLGQSRAQLQRIPYRTFFLIAVLTWLIVRSDVDCTFEDSWDGSGNALRSAIIPGRSGDSSSRRPVCRVQICTNCLPNRRASRPHEGGCDRLVADG